MNNFLNCDFYNIIQNNNYSYSYIIKTNLLSPDKYYFSFNSDIKIPNLINFETKKDIWKKKCHFHKDFNNSYVLYFRNFDVIEFDYLIPTFQCKKFKCLKCNVIHNLKTQKCCDMIQCPIEIIEAELINIYLPNKSEINKSILNSRENFLELHFPDILDKIILR